jgi:hypothetical protein
MEPGVPVHPVWVLAIGPTRYMVFDKERMSAGRLLVAIYSTFTWLADMIG